ncbi:TIR domain-containing protein [bacterium]|nr:TIR domain-containing protein [bacterium]
MSHRKIFISYARTDSKLLAHRLCSDLQTAGYNVWLDTSEIAVARAGRRILSRRLKSAAS